MRKFILPAALLALAAATPAAAQVKRIGAPTSPILQAAVVPAGTDIMYVSGITPPPVNAGALAGTAPEFGDTKTQTIGVLKRIEAILAAEGLTHGDVFMMRVLLVGDPAKGGAMDFAGMNAAYAKLFGTKEQPHRPTRSTFQVAGLAVTGALVEIDVVAARVKP